MLYFKGLTKVTFSLTSSFSLLVHDGLYLPKALSLFPSVSEGNEGA